MINFGGGSNVIDGTGGWCINICEAIVAWDSDSRWCLGDDIC